MKPHTLALRSAALSLLVLGLAAAQLPSVGYAEENRPSGARLGRGAAPQCTDTLLPPTGGVYVVTKLNQPLPESVLGLTSLDGIAIRVGWRALQPTAQEPSFALIDGQLAAARRFSKKVSLSIEAGTETPDWVYTLGARPYSFVLDDQNGDKTCQRVRIPIPWDPVYLDAFKQLVHAASRRFNRSNLLTHIKVTGLGGTGQAIALPHAAARSLSNGRQTCSTVDEVAAWLDLGYSRQRILSTWRELVELFTQDFSSHRLAVIVDTQGMPPIDGQGQLMRGVSYDTELVPELLQSAVSGRQARILVQSNELTNTSVYPFPVRLGDEVSIGYQLRWPVTHDKQYRMNGGNPESEIAIFDGAVRRCVAARGRFLEVQLPDALDPQLSPSFAGARILLRRGMK